MANIRAGWWIVTVGYLLAAVAGAQAQQGGPVPTPPPGFTFPPGFTPPPPPVPAVPSAWAKPTGAYPVVMEEAVTLPDHTIYRPADLAEFRGSRRLPVVAFAGPGCDFNGTAYRPFFTELASHGYLVVASGPPEPRGGSGQGFMKTRPSDISASISWALAENARAASTYFKKVDSDKVAVMGQSCGGQQAISLSSDPRIKTIVMWNSAVFYMLPGFAPGLIVSKDNVRAVRVPIAYFTGETDFTKPSTLEDFAMHTGPSLVGILQIPGDAHLGTFRQHNGGKFGAVGVAWLDWQLKGSQDAAKMFRGSACGICSDPEWKLTKRNID